MTHCRCYSTFFVCPIEFLCINYSALSDTHTVQLYVEMVFGGENIGILYKQNISLMTERK